MPIHGGDIVRASVNFVLGDGSQYQNVWHHIKVGATEHTNAFVTAAYVTHFNTVYGHLEDRAKVTVLPALCSLDQVEFVEGQWTITQNVGTWTPTWTGSSAGDPMPNQVSPYVLYKTPRPKTVGRKFLFPMTETNFDGSYIDGTLVTSITDFATASMVDIYLGVIDDMEMCIPRVGVAVEYRITHAIVTNVTGSQRRRRPGVGA